jgi:hypothetical protein
MAVWIRAGWLRAGCAAVASALVGGCSPGPGGVACASVSPDAATTAPANTCYPDSDGIDNQPATIDLAVNDTGFFATGPDAGPKPILATQNASTVALTLTNTGTKPHGFEVGCVSVCSSYATLPAGCSPIACFPPGSTIAPIDPGSSAVVTFVTPTPDGLIYPFMSSAPSDANVPGLNDGQWSLM